MKVKEIMPLVDSHYLVIKDFSESHSIPMDILYRMHCEDDVSCILKNYGEKYVHIVIGEKDTVKLIVYDKPFEAE